MSLTRFSQQDIVVSTDSLVTSTWSNNTNNLQVGYTASNNNFDAPTSSGWFHLDVYNINPTGSGAEIQYSVAYGNRLGSGSPDFTNDSGSHGYNASRVTYGAYRNLIYGDENQFFTFGTHVPDDIYIININRARYKQSLKPGTLNLDLSSSLQITPAIQTEIHLTDDSVTTNGSAKLTNLGRQFNIVSGSSGIAKDGTHLQIGTSNNITASYGLFYPDAGIIILNAEAFGAGSATFTGLGANKNRGEMANYTGAGNRRNPEELFYAISMSAGGFIVDSEEKITSQYYFARAKNFEYNYTTNPSFTDNKGNLNFSSMINNPVTYITTVGLYNDSNDLVAVAKLSQPIVKDFTKEALIRVKLDY
jgi:hypothetical protein